VTTPRSPQPRLILDRTRREGYFARLRAEEARTRWFESRTKDVPQAERDELWGTYRRREVGAYAEETAGRFLNQLRGWRTDCWVYHAAEFRGLPGGSIGDVDHLVVFRELGFAFAVETKFRVTDDTVANFGAQAQRAAETAQRYGDFSWVFPVLCDAEGSFRGGRRGFELDGTTLVATAEDLPDALLWPVVEFDDFRIGGWRFPEHRKLPAPPTALVDPPPSPERFPPAIPTHPPVEPALGAVSKPYAGFVLRLAALVADVAIVGFAGLALGALLEASPGGPTAVLSAMIAIAYFGLLEGGRRGQTLGKRGMRIRVVDINSAGQIGPARAVIRLAGRAISTAPYLLGFIWMLWDEHNQTWHDKLASSVVVPVSGVPIGR
jgi:uncharacterized RDD family membrane protein YckC